MELSEIQPAYRQCRSLKTDGMCISHIGLATYILAESMGVASWAAAKMHGWTS